MKLILVLKKNQQQRNPANGRGANKNRDACDAYERKEKKETETNDELQKTV